MSSGLLVQVHYSNKCCPAMSNEIELTLSFKLQVVQYAEKHGKRPAGINLM
jgi:hypothetical protein